MDVQRIISEIDAEITKLQEVRSSLAGISGNIAGVTTGRRGRPKGSKNAPKTGAKTAGKRRLSPEGRKAIADAMKRRWAERRKETGKKESAK